MNTSGGASLTGQPESAFAHPNTLQPVHVLQHPLSTSLPSYTHAPGALNTAQAGTQHPRPIDTDEDEADDEQPTRKRSKKSPEYSLSIPCLDVTH